MNFAKIGLQRGMAAIAIAIGLGAATTPAAADVISSEMRITGIVPTICNVRFGNMMSPTNSQVIDLGAMTQLCNDGAGYRIILRTPAGLSQATFVYGSNRIALSDSGETVIVDSNMPNFSVDHARIELNGAAQENFALSIEAQPKGMIY